MFREYNFFVLIVFLESRNNAPEIITNIGTAHLTKESQMFLTSHSMEG